MARKKSDARFDTEKNSAAKEIISVKKSIEDVENTMKKYAEQKSERTAAITSQADERFEQLMQTFNSALAFPAIHEKYLSVGKEHSFADMTNRCRTVLHTLSGMKDKYAEVEDKLTYDWEQFLDCWCKYDIEEIDCYDECVDQLLVLDVCQAVWGILKNFREMNAQADKDLKAGEDKLAELKNRLATLENPEENKAE